MKKIYYLLAVVFIIGCKKKVQKTSYFKKYIEDSEILNQQDHENPRMKFKLLQSKYLDLNKEFEPFREDLIEFSDEEYGSLKTLILEQDIPSIQNNIKKGLLTYEKLTLFYLYRILKFESDSTKHLNAIISLNPNVLNEARQMDESKEHEFTEFSLYGMPILLKDNINTKNMFTTAGAAVLKNNLPSEDAHIVERLKESGALILGKANLSEWAYFFCNGCPLGYSAIGGQTLNPYGRKIFETGGSSSGSGVAIASNYAVAAIGTETAGSITSPSSKNSLVGLKPTTGVLSRSGIVPISGYLDTPGPMTKNVIDNAILFKAMVHKDDKDSSTEIINKLPMDYFNYTWDSSYFKNKNIGVLKALLEDPIYKKTVEDIEKEGGNLVYLTPEEMDYNGFLNLLTTEMKHDLPKYLKSYTSDSITVKSVKEVVDFNTKDSVKRAPYGQELFENIARDTTSVEKLAELKKGLKREGENFLKALDNSMVDVILSIDNYHSAVAAVAHYPTITVPMGYKNSGEPTGLTFVGKPLSEKKLLEFAYAFEKLIKARRTPKNYQ
ncbi:amidase [Tenacibaculum sp. MAR_2009_124]|uniref:amidase family protein n=1 Tax=Tenacibaculum sp. MAR_2009_124 TaxID=1250059 RepID=UPI00089CC062|nr:amidase family protein [Tenacibaculum sp. MAR_2009_124]SEB82435.1 amidase [Tenacibaculum sp. MAR_2009_124]